MGGATKTAEFMLLRPREHRWHMGAISSCWGNEVEQMQGEPFA